VAPLPWSTSAPGYTPPLAGLEQVTINGRNFYRVSKPPYLTRAVIVAAGIELWEWTSVSLTRGWNNNPPTTWRFVTSEQELPNDPEGWSALRLRPPDPCRVFLDGWLAGSGFIKTRQVFYDANQHVVELQGVSTVDMSNYTPAGSKTGEFQNKDVLQMAQQLFGMIDIGTSARGVLTGKKFDRAAPQPSESIWDFVERFARSSKALMGDDEQGNFVLGGSAFPGNGRPQLIEGFNVVSGREIIISPQQAGTTIFSGQGPGSDKQSMSDVAQPSAKGSATDNTGSMMSGSLGRSLSEIPFFAQGLLQDRVTHENNINDSNLIYVYITVVGWQRPSGGLWAPGDEVLVYSPMLIMQRPLMIKSVTYSQDSNGGTKSVLELVNPTALGQGTEPMTGGQ